MLRRLLDILALARNLFSLRAQLGLVLTRKSIVLGLVGIASALVASVGMLLLLASAVVALAPVVGYAVALAIVGSATIATAAIVWIAARHHHRGPDTDDRPVRASEDTLRARIEEHEDRLHVAMGGRSSNRPSRSGSNRAGSLASANGATASPGRFDHGRTDPANGHTSDSRGAHVNGTNHQFATPTNVLAAGFAAAAMLGPRRVARSFRLLTFLGSATTAIAGLRRGAERS